MHLSKENNTEELALNEIKKVFEDYNILFDDIKCAKADVASEVVEI